MSVPAELLVSKYVEYRDYIAKEQEAFNARMKPYNEAMDLIANQGLAMLNEQSSGDEASIRTSKGTMYKSTTLSTRVVDADAFLTYVFNTGARDLVTAAAAKKAVSEFIDKHGVTPPGVDVTQVSKCLFRRS